MALSVGNHPAQRSAHGFALVTFDGSFLRGGGEKREITVCSSQFLPQLPTPFVLAFFFPSSLRASSPIALQRIPEDYPSLRFNTKYRCRFLSSPISFFHSHICPFFLSPPPSFLSFASENVKGKKRL